MGQIGTFQGAHQGGTCSACGGLRMVPGLSYCYSGKVCQCQLPPLVRPQPVPIMVPVPNQMPTLCPPPLSDMVLSMLVELRKRIEVLEAKENESAK